MADGIKRDPEVRKIWWISVVIQTALGFTNGLYLYTWGPYFYEKFGGAQGASVAILLTAVLLGVRQGLVALLEVPTGALADSIGRVHVVVLSWGVRVLFFVSLAAIWLCKSVGFAFMWGVFASITFAFAYTCLNGAFSAWCVEALKERAPHVNYGWLASRFSSYRALAKMLGGVAGILFFLKGMAFGGFILAAFISFCCIGYSINKIEEVKSIHFLSTKKVGLTVVLKHIGETIGKSVQVCKKVPVIFWLVLTFGSYMFLLNVVEYLWPVFFKSNFGSGETFARDWLLIMIISQLLVTASSRVLVVLNRYWTKKGGLNSHLIGFRRIFVATASIASIAVLFLSLNTAYHLISFYYVFPVAVILVILAFGIIYPSFETLINLYIPPEESQRRATLISCGSMIRSLLVLLLAVPSGGSSGETTAVGWSIPAALLLCSSLLAFYFMKSADKKLISNYAPASKNMEPVEYEH